MRMWAGLSAVSLFKTGSPTSRTGLTIQLHNKPLKNVPLVSHVNCTNALKHKEALVVWRMACFLFCILGFVSYFVSLHSGIYLDAGDRFVDAVQSIHKQ